MSPAGIQSALPVLFFCFLAQAPLALVIVGLAVASAHRPQVLGADLRNLDAGPFDIGSAATSGLGVAPKPGIALDSGTRAALLADLGSLYVARPARQGANDQRSEQKRI